MCLNLNTILVCLFSTIAIEKEEVVFCWANGNLVDMIVRTSIQDPLNFKNPISSINLISIPAAHTTEMVYCIEECVN